MEIGKLPSSELAHLTDDDVSGLTADYHEWLQSSVGDEWDAFVTRVGVQHFEPDALC